MPSKYQPLTHALATIAERGQKDIEFSFDEIAALVGGLPPSAGQRQWWANTDHPQALAWHAAGYHVEHVSLERRRVRFTQAGEWLAPSQSVGSTPAPDPITTAEKPIDVRLQMGWTNSGVVTLDTAGKPAFPHLGGLCGLYRLTFKGADGADARVYIGESDNLHRRLSTNYRNPGSTQPTSLRINALLREHLALGLPVLLAVATSATVVIDNIERSLDLTTKMGRLLAESAALVHARADGDAQIVNLG